MTHDNYRIRPMTFQEVETIAVEWAAQEGWNPGLVDAVPFFETDPRGFLAGELNGEIIACISAVAYDEIFGFIGFYIVKPEFRGRGFGLQLWRAAMTYLGNRNIGLDGVLEQQANYRTSGFTFAYSNIRYEGVGGGTTSAQVQSLVNVPYEKILAYDTTCFPVARSRFLQAWLAMPQAESMCVVKDGELRGYGMIRPCRNGFKIGPLFADTPEWADDIFRSLCARVSATDTVYLDIPEVNKAAVALTERHNMRAVFSTARMYTREAPRMPLEKIFGVTTFELG